MIPIKLTYKTRAVYINPDKIVIFCGSHDLEPIASGGTKIRLEGEAFQEVDQTPEQILSELENHQLINSK